MLFAGNRLTAQNHRDNFLLVDRRLVGQRVRQSVVLPANHQCSFGGLGWLGPLLGKECRRAGDDGHPRQ
jgi:hypothetical protein